MKKHKKPSSLRSETKYHSVKPNLNLKSRFGELSDINEYFDTLPPEAQEWLSKYADNFVNADFREQNILTPESTKALLKQYIKDIKNYKGDKKVKDFVSKYLIREDNVPIKIIREMFFEQDDKKLLKLVDQLKDAITSNISKASKREVNKVIKIIQKEVYNINNARNRDVLTQAHASGQLNYIEELDETEFVTDEDDLIMRIDLKRELEKLKK